MISISGWWVNGMSVGLILFDEDDNEAAGSHWGFTLFLTIFAVTIVKLKPE